MLVSIIVPSLRPELAEGCINSIHKNAGDLDYEIVVVSPFDVEPHEKVVHVKEKERGGTGKAIATGYKKAEGEYIMHFNDHCRVLTSLNIMMDFMRPHDKEIFEGRFFTIDVKTMDAEKQGVLIERGDYVDHAIRVFGKVFAGFMCMRKDKADEIGGFLDYPYYKAWFLDPDLSLRVWKAGGRMETCNDARVLLLPEPKNDTVVPQNRKYYKEDSEAFHKRWGRDFSHEE